MALIEITHHRARQRHTGGSPDRLHDPPGDYRRNATREGAASRADHKQHEPDCDRQAPAVAIADRPPQELTQAEANQVAGDGPLHRASVGVEGAAHGWHCGQIEVGRDRPEAHQEAEDAKHPPALADHRGADLGESGGVACARRSRHTQPAARDEDTLALNVPGHDAFQYSTTTQAYEEAQGLQGQRHSAACGGHKLLRIALALDVNLGQRSADLDKIGLVQHDIRGVEILLEPMQLRGAGDRYDPGPLRQKPSERDLRCRCFLLTGDALQQIDQRLVLLQCLRREARQNLPEIIFSDLRVLADRARQEALAQGTVGHEADAELFAGLDNAVRLRSARPQRILVLQRGDRLDGVGAPNRLRTGLRQPEMLHLARRDQLLDCAGDILDRHVRINAVLVEEIDALDAEPLERGIRNLLYLLRPAIHARHLAVHDIEAEFGGDHHLTTEGLERLADNLLVSKWAVYLGRIKEGDAALNCRADQGDAVVLAQRMAVAEVEPHAAEADSRDLETAFSKSTLLHRSFSLTVATLRRRVDVG